VTIRDNPDMSVSTPVSVIIPCYRCWDTIERAVASVAGQTWRPAELILIDDASADETPEVLHTLQNRHGSDWIKLIVRQENGGPGGARNAGLAVASQPYVAFLDADDAWHPRKIEIQLGYMLDHPEVAITGHRSRWLQKERDLLPLRGSHKTRSISKYQMLVANRLATRTVMLKREIKCLFEPGAWYSEDYLLWLQIICQGHQATLLNLELAYSYKAPYGAGGWTGDLWAAEKRELHTYKRLHEERLVSLAVSAGVSVFSLAKYARRLAVHTLRSQCVRLRATRSVARFFENM